MFEKMESKLHIVNKFNVFGAIAIVLVLVGLVSLVLLPFGVNFFNLDIDFAGGTTMTFDMHKTLDKAELDNIKSIVEKTTGVTVSSVQKSGEEDNEVVIKSETLDTAQRDEAFIALKEAYGLHDGTEQVAEGETAHTDVISVDNVDPVMGKDLRDAAIKSAFLAILFMLIYIALRFDVRSGVAAVAALAHDVLVVIGSYVVFRIPLNLTFIAVILTILGYSINATIVIFDRIRENKKIIKKTSFGDIVNKSIWQTATRSVNTTVTTLLSVAMIAIFGVSSIKYFAIPLVVGIIAGLYSSMFISGPIWVKLTNASKKA